MEKYKLGEISEFIRNGASIKQFDNADGYPITRIETISNFKIDFEKMGYANIHELGKYEDYLLKDGDILMSHINSDVHLGKSAIMEDDNKKIIHGMNLLCIRLKKEMANSKYMYYYFNHKLFRNKLSKIIKKSVNQASFSVTDLKKIDIEIPNLENQKKIVEVLDKAKSLIDKKKEQIELLDELVKSRFIDMFGDPIRNSKNLKMKNFEEVIVLQRGYDLPTYKRDENGEYNVWGSNGVLSKHSEYKIKEYGVITGRSGSLGNVYYTKEPYWPLNTTLFSKDTCGNNVVYLTYLLRFYDLKRFSNGTGVPTLNRNLLNGQKIIDVPIELQNEFAEFVTQTDSIRSKMESSLSELEDNFNSLMQKAFKGELF